MRTRPTCRVATTSEHAVAFGRGTCDGVEVVTVVTRLAGRLADAGGFGDATVELPEGTLVRRRLGADLRRWARRGSPTSSAAAGRGPAGRAARAGTGRGMTADPISVWAPSASARRRPRHPGRRCRAPSRRRRRTARHDRRRRRLVVVDARRRRRHRSTTPSASTAGTRDPTRAAPGCRTACTARAAPSTRRHTPGATGTGVARATDAACSAGSSTSCTSAPSRPRAPSTPPSAISGTSSSSASTSSRSCPSRPSAARTAGATTGSRRMPSSRPTAVRLPSSASSTRATRRGLGVCLDVVYNHLGPTGNYLAEFGPYFTDTHTTPVGSGRQPRRRGQPRGAPLGRRQRAAVVPRLPRRRAASRRRARAARRARSRTSSPSCPTRPLLSQRSSDARSTSSPRATSTTPSW